MSTLNMQALPYFRISVFSNSVTMPTLDMQALALWTKLGIEKAHVVSHDMGDSVLTEILTR